jgi:hypothetical protein
VHTLVKRYETEGTAAFEPRSRRPHQPQRGQPRMKDRIMWRRKTLTRRGLDAGAQTIIAHGDIIKVTVRQGVQDVDGGKVYAAGASAVLPLRLA